MLKNRGLALKLIFLILTSITLIFSFVFIYNYSVSRQIISQNVEKNARNLARATINRIDTVLHGVEKVPNNLSYVLESLDYVGGDLMELIRSVVENNPEIYGATIAFEPHAYDKNALTFAPYFYKNKGKVEFTYIPYEYFYWDWYQIPKELNGPAWTEPYYDEGAGEIIMATYSVPFYKTILGERRLIGVVTADISLSWLQDIVSSIKIAETGYGFLLSKNGTFVTHPDQSFIMNETIFSVAEARGDAKMRELGRQMTRGQSGFVPFRSLLTGKECWMVYAPLPSSGWSLGVLFPQDELMADISSLNRMVLFLSLGGFSLIFLVIVLIARSITKPLVLLSAAAEIIATGNLDIEIPRIKSRDEVGRLSDSFNYMKTSLNRYIKELTETTAAKERIESELKIAHDIQMGILPKIFPPFPERPEFEIYATIEPAKEVGGDLYDFFFMDDNHLCFTVGDVSGKGVPASLFMAITKTIIKIKATQGLTPDKVLSRVNQDLALDNPSLMFVTLFLGILDTRTGELEYSNGGHNPPYLLRHNGDLEPLETTKGMALGVMEDFSYQSRKVFLKKGDVLFSYTDGVTEAMNQRGDLFSESRLKKELMVLRNSSLEQITDGIMDKARAFSQGLPQTDDITILILRYKGLP
ncbi:MAG: SpoIIE family protein phosphatase [Pseudomonadota bacterium]